METFVYSVNSRLFLNTLVVIDMGLPKSHGSVKETEYVVDEPENWELNFRICPAPRKLPNVRSIIPTKRSTVL